MKAVEIEHDILLLVVFLASIYLPIGFSLGFWFNYMYACTP